MWCVNQSVKASRVLHKLVRHRNLLMTFSFHTKTRWIGVLFFCLQSFIQCVKWVCVFIRKPLMNAATKSWSQGGSMVTRERAGRYLQEVKQVDASEVIHKRTRTDQAG